MALRFTRVAGVTQYAMTPVEVPVNLVDESLGTIHLRLREIPAGLNVELHNRMRADDFDAIPELIAWGVAGHDPNEFMEEAPDGTLTPIPYQSDTAEYHGKVYAVAHPDTVRLYQDALPKGLLLYSIRAALLWYQSGIVPTPRQLWDSAKPKKEALPNAEGALAPDGTAPTTST
jgi:hypothetical protein